MKTILSYKIYAVMAVIVITVVVWLIRQLSMKISLTFGDELGASYILRTKDTKKAFKAYMKLREQNFERGMIISRQFPDRIRQRYEVEESTFLWLSREKTPESIDPSDLEKLEYLIHEFVSAKEKSLVLLDGIEYIILQNSFESTLKFLQSLNDQIILNKATLVIPLDPASLNKKELSLIERELETLQVDYRLSRFFE
ncbi:MAG: DUF835 domain-containing protein [Candidatus Methanofastidiosia archaeon]